MKTILVPTDFSDASKNAMEYAVELAKQVKATIVLFHSFHLPIITSEIPAYVVSLDELEKDFLSDLKKLARAIHHKHGDKIRVECSCSCGFAREEIEKAAEKVKADLIIMGMRGAGPISEKLMGSVTTDVIKKSNHTVLVIHKDVKFKGPKRIALACDYQETPPRHVFEPVKQLARAFKASVYVVNVTNEVTAITSSKAAAGIHLEHDLEDVQHSYHFIDNKDVVDGINQFVKTEKIDIVVMMHHEKGIWEKIFSGSKTKDMAFHSSVPLLTIKNK
jgi:nucleotide-binding universal stress UspA family protein